MISDGKNIQLNSTEALRLSTVLRHFAQLHGSTQSDILRDQIMRRRCEEILAEMDRAHREPFREVSS